MEMLRENIDSTFSKKSKEAVAEEKNYLERLEEKLVLIIVMH